MRDRRTDDSVTDSLPSRAPADQGTGNREQGTGKGVVNSPSIHRYVSRCASPIDRLLAKIAPDANGCWLWTGSIGGGGYGRFKTHRTTYAHRAAYEMMVGPIPRGLELDHLCRVRRCVNPVHLEAVTRSENQRRGQTVAAVNATRTHCPQGHPYTDPNTGTSVRSSGLTVRYCRACKRDRYRQQHGIAS